MAFSDNTISCSFSLFDTPSEYLISVSPFIPTQKVIITYFYNSKTMSYE